MCRDGTSFVKRQVAAKQDLSGKICEFLQFFNENFRRKITTHLQQTSHV